MPAIDLSKKFLVQDIREGTSFTPYDTYLLACTNDRIYIPSGQGKEVTYKNQINVGTFNKNDFGGGVRTDRQDLENFIMSDSLVLPDSSTSDSGIVKAVFDESEWLYPEYFLTGKLPEQYEKIKAVMAPTMRKFEFKLLIAAQTVIANMLNSATAEDYDGSTIPTTAHVTGTATTQIPALTQFELFVNAMTFDNTFANAGQYLSTPKPLPAGMYVNANINNLVFIVHPSLKYKLQNNLHNWSVRDKEKFEKLVESFIEFPLQYKDPTNNTMTAINLLEETQILVIEKTYFDRIYNYNAENSQYYNENQTIRYYNFLREAVGFYKFTSVGLFDCAGLIEVVAPADASDSKVVKSSKKVVKED